MWGSCQVITLLYPIFAVPPSFPSSSLSNMLHFSLFVYLLFFFFLSCLFFPFPSYKLFYFSDFPLNHTFFHFPLFLISSFHLSYYIPFLSHFFIFPFPVSLILTPLFSFHYNFISFHPVCTISLLFIIPPLLSPFFSSHPHRFQFCSVFLIPSLCFFYFPFPLSVHLLFSSIFSHFSVLSSLFFFPFIASSP